MASNDIISKSEIEEVLAKDPKLKGKKIHFVKSDRVKELRPWVDEVIKAIGVRAAFLTDESSMADFGPCFDEEEGPTLKSISEDLGVEVALNDFIVDVAERLRDKVNGKTH